jgi:hypothetical protein
MADSSLHGSIHGESRQAILALTPVFALKSVPFVTVPVIRAVICPSGFGQTDREKHGNSVGKSLVALLKWNRQAVKGLVPSSSTPRLFTIAIVAPAIAHRSYVPAVSYPGACLTPA